MAEFKSEMQKLQFEALKELIAKRNGLVGQVNAATGNRDSVFEAVANSDDNEEIAALRVQLAEIEEQFEALVNAEVDKVIGNASESSDELLAEVKDIDGTVRAGASYYKKLYGDDAAADLPKIVRLKGKSGGGTGGKRIRGYNVIVTVDDGEATEFENFAAAAKYLGAETKDLQDQFFAKAGVEKLKDAPDEVTFGLSWVETEEDGETETNHSASVKAYRTGESGVPSASDDEEPTDEDLEDAAEDEDEDPLANI